MRRLLSSALATGYYITRAPERRAPRLHEKLRATIPT